MSVGRILGTDDAHPLDFWVGVADDQYLQLDDIIAVETPIHGHRQHNQATLYGVVDIVRSRHEGGKFDSDVFLTDVIPMGIATAAHVSVTRIEPEIFVPPQPGQEAFRANEAQREQALYFDQMTRKFPIGVTSDDQVVYGNVDFLDGAKGAHVNISGVSGVASKTSYSLFLLHSVFSSDALNPHTANTKAIVFNLKGEDLLFLDQPNTALTKRDAELYNALGLPMQGFQDVSLWAPVSRDWIHLFPDATLRREGIKAFVWTLKEFCRDRLLRFLFAEADSETSLMAFVVSQVERRLADIAEEQDPKKSHIDLPERGPVTSFRDLVRYIHENIRDLAPFAADPTREAFARRLYGIDETFGHLIRGNLNEEEMGEHCFRWDRQINVIHIGGLPERAKRFVVGVVLKRVMDERRSAKPGLFVVLDELNKYAPRDGSTPIKEVVLDIAERGRSLGVILIGAQQTASEVERRVVANSSFRVAGRLDSAEARRDEYGFLLDNVRSRTTILKPGQVFVHQPDIPVPLAVRFPRPPCATTPEQAGVSTEERLGFDP